MDSLIGVGGESEWETGGRLYLPLGHRQQCAPSSGHKWPQFPGEVQVVIGSSLALCTVLLVPHNHTKSTTVHSSGLIGLPKSYLKKQTWPSTTINVLVCLDSV